MADRDDLLRVDVTGTVHPVGKTASQEMRARAGEWRLAPGVEGVVLMRRPDKIPTQGTLRLAGEIKSPGALCDIVALIAQSNWKGELVVIDDKKVRSIYFDQGLVVGAQTNVPEERLGETLYRFGVVTRAQLDEAISRAAASGKRFGEMAMELAFVSPSELFPMMARQVEEVFYAAIHVADGVFYFFDKFDEKVLARRHNLNAGALLMEGARRMDELAYFREKIPSANYIPVPKDTGGKPPEEVAQVLALCDGTRTIAEIGRRLGMLEFDVTRAIFQLTSGGFVTVVAPRPKGPEDIVEGFNPALVEIHAVCDRHGKGAELREGLARFATGGGVYDPLFQGAGPLPDGSLRPERIRKNLAALAGDDPDAWLIQLMHDYVGFALFQAGSLLPRPIEKQLAAGVAEMLKPLRPVESSPLSRR
jgi:hypothetical protein